MQREKFTMQDDWCRGVGRIPQPPEVRGLGKQLPVFSDFYNFLMKITRF